MTTSDIFITAGKFKHLRLSTPSKGTHPMGQRQRLALFNMLDCEGKHVLDLFAGSGALGFEALSRAAATVTFVDKNTTAIVKNIAHLASTASGAADQIKKSCQVYQANVLTCSLADQYDLVFADPPYDQPVFFDQTSISIYSSFVKSGATLVLSRPKTLKITPPDNLQLEKTRSYAGLSLDFFLKV